MIQWESAKVSLPHILPIVSPLPSMTTTVAAIAATIATSMATIADWTHDLGDDWPDDFPDHGAVDRPAVAYMSSAVASAVATTSTVATVATAGLREGGDRANNCHHYHQTEENTWRKHCCHPIP